MRLSSTTEGAPIFNIVVVSDASWPRSGQESEWIEVGGLIVHHELIRLEFAQNFAAPKTVALTLHISNGGLYNYRVKVLIEYKQISLIFCAQVTFDEDGAF